MYVYTKERCFKDGLGFSLCRELFGKEEPEHLHEFVELVYIFNGTGTHCIDGVEYRVSRGSLLFINYRQVHSFRTDGEMQFCNILLDPEWISEKLIDTENAFELLTLSSFSHFQQAVDLGESLVRFSGEDQVRFEEILRNTEEEQRRKEVGYETLLKSYVTILLTMVFRKMSGSNSMGGYEKLTPDFLNYIRSHCEEPLTLEDLSKRCFYNPSYFSRLFKEQFGVTVTEFITRSRLEKAMEYLSDPSVSVEAAASRAGFRRMAGFYSLFRERTGMTPAEFRKSKKT